MPIGAVECGGRRIEEGELRSLSGDLIKEALLRARPNVRVIRADEMPDPGSITAQIFGLLANADYVVADITWPNLNVFYELGILSCPPKMSPV
jgi:hypothetical protein